MYTDPLKFEAAQEARTALREVVHLLRDVGLVSSVEEVAAVGRRAVDVGPEGLREEATFDVLDLEPERPHGLVVDQVFVFDFHQQLLHEDGLGDGHHEQLPEVSSAVPTRVERVALVLRLDHLVAEVEQDVRVALLVHVHGDQIARQEHFDGQLFLLDFDLWRQRHRGQLAELEALVGLESRLVSGRLRAGLSRRRG